VKRLLGALGETSSQSHVPPSSGVEGMAVSKRQARAHAAIAQLNERFPAVFTRTARRPLKIGIHGDLLASGFERKLVMVALRSYCGSSGYLSALREGTARIGLDGDCDDGVKQAIATKLIELAKAGERNPDLLCERVLEEIRPSLAQDPARLRDTPTRNEGEIFELSPGSRNGFCRPTFVPQPTDRRSRAVVTQAEEFRAKAKECEERAERTIDPLIKQRLIELAQRWRDLATYREKQPRQG
jgi:hypothetical protein